MKINYDVINSKHYFEILNKPEELTEEEAKKMQTYTEFTNNSMKYRDYLLDYQKKQLDNYEQGINQLAMLETEHPEITLNSKQTYAIEQYRKNKQYLDELDREKVRILEKNDVSSGFANSFILILSVLATGILIGLILLIITK